MSHQLFPSNAIERIRAIHLRTVLFWLVLLLVQANLIMIYLIVSDDRIVAIRYAVIYPLIWINVAIWVAMNTRPIPTRMRPRVIAGVIGLVYFIVLLAVPGRIGLIGDPSTLFDASIRMNIPGWGPIISVEALTLRGVFIPYEIAGYAAIAYLVSANLLRVSRTSLAGLLGVVTCVGCTMPVIIPVLGAFGGIGSAMATVTASWFYDIGTVVFLLAVALLYHGHRP